MLRFLGVLPATRINGDQRKGFLTHMSKHNGDKQVKQADTALRLYDYFLSREMKATAEGIHASARNWNMLEERMRAKLRLRQEGVKH
jgi:hypothetical protein